MTRPHAMIQPVIDALMSHKPPVNVLPSRHAAALLEVLQAIQTRLRGMAESPTDKDCVAFFDSVGVLLQNAGLDTTPLPAFTVFVQHKSRTGTMHIEAYRAEGSTVACAMALERVANDWVLDGTDSLAVVGVVEGNVNILEWYDADE